jgi:hypothetical protein
MWGFGLAVRVERFEDPDGVLFRVTNERRLMALCVPAAAGAALFWFAWRQDVSWLVLVAAAAVIGYLVWRWFQVRVTELRVTERELIVEGEAEAMVWLPWSAVSGLQFQEQREGAAAGLYAFEGAHDRRCLVPGVSEAQAGRMLEAIYRRFPVVARVSG